MKQIFFFFGGGRMGVITGPSGPLLMQHQTHRALCDFGPLGRAPVPPFLGEGGVPVKSGLSLEVSPLRVPPVPPACLWLGCRGYFYTGPAGDVVW